MRVPDGVSTIDWTADDYIPSELLVARILASSQRARFRMPARLLHARERGRLTPRRAAGLVVGMIGIGPALLVAAVLNLAGFGAFGSWLASRDFRVPPPTPRYTAVERVHFVSPGGNTQSVSADSLRRVAERLVRDTVWSVVNQDVAASSALDSIAPRDSTRLARAVTMLMRFPDVGVRIAGDETAARRIEEFFVSRGVAPKRVTTVAGIRGSVSIRVVD